MLGLKFKEMLEWSSHQVRLITYQKTPILQVSPNDEYALGHALNLSLWVDLQLWQFRQLPSTS
jgi:hypothetical protein